MIRCEPYWVIETWGALSYLDQTSPAARLMWLKQLVAQDMEHRRFSPPLCCNYWSTACSDICRSSWSMSGLNIDHSCISSQMKLQGKSVSSCAVRKLLDDFVRLFYASACLHTVRMKEHKTPRYYACTLKLYLTCQRDDWWWSGTCYCILIYTSAKPAKINLKKVLC